MPRIIDDETFKTIQGHVHRLRNAVSMDAATRQSLASDMAMLLIDLHTAERPSWCQADMSDCRLPPERCCEGRGRMRTRAPIPVPANEGDPVSGADIPYAVMLDGDDWRRLLKIKAALFGDGSTLTADKRRDLANEMHLFMTRRIALTEDDTKRMLPAFYGTTKLEDDGHGNKRLASPPETVPRYVVDGHEFENEESSFLGDGQFPPFVVFDVKDQTNVGPEWPSRELAQAEANRLNDEGKPGTIDTVYVVAWDGPSSGGHDWLYDQGAARERYAAKSLDPDYKDDHVRLLQVRLDPPKARTDKMGIETELRLHDMDSFPEGTHITLLVERTADTRTVLPALEERFMPGERTTFQRIPENGWFRTANDARPLRKYGPMMRPDTPVQRMVPNGPTQPTTNEYARAVAILSAHLMAGFLVESAKHPGEGCEMLIQGGWLAIPQRLAELATQFQDWITTWIGDGREYPGVFEYEVVEPMGVWYYKHSMCMADEFMAEAKKQTEAFFKQ